MGCLNANQARELPLGVSKNLTSDADGGPELGVRFHLFLKLFSAQLSRQQTCGHIEKQQIAIKHLKVIAREDSLRDSAKLTGWLYQVTRNGLIDLLRSNRRLDELR